MGDTFTRDDLNRVEEEIEEVAEELEEAEEVEAEEVEETEADDDLDAAITRLRGDAGERATRTEAPAAAAPPAEEVDEPMPDLADPDIAFDTDKLRTKMKAWVVKNSERAAVQAVMRVRDSNAAAKAMQNVEKKVTRFAKDHADFDTVVRKNKILAQNPLGPDAGTLIQESEFTAELLYQFGKDTNLAVRTARMTPREQVAQITRMIVALENGKRTTRTSEGGQRQTLTRKGPLTREQQLGGKSSMNDIAAQHRAKIKGSRFYNK